MVFNTVLSIVQQQEEAEDVAQEVFVQAFISITKFRGDSKISTWLYRIAVTKALDHQRKKKSKKRFGLLKNVFGIGLPRTAQEQYNSAVSIELNELQEGDLVFFKTGSKSRRVSHVGVFLLNNKLS